MTWACDCASTRASVLHCLLRSVKAAEAAGEHVGGRSESVVGAAGTVPMFQIVGRSTRTARPLTLRVLMRSDLSSHTHCC